MDDELKNGLCIWAAIMLTIVLIAGGAVYIAAMINNTIIKNCIELGGEFDGKCIVRRNDEA